MNVILETERLVLREWTLTDADALYEILSDREVVKYLADSLPFSREKVEQFLTWAVEYQRENGFCRWATIEKSSGKIIGSCGLARRYTEEVELGYLFAQEFWGKGYATEAAGAALNYGFETLRLEKIIALTDPENLASQKVLEKIGFVLHQTEHLDSVVTIVFLAVNPNRHN